MSRIVAARRLCRRRSLLAVMCVCCLLSAACGRPEAASAGAARPAADASVDVPPPEREGEDWPIFLGPRGTGVSEETGFDDAWPKNGPPVLWEKRVGTGYSAPSIRGHQLVVHHRVGDREIVECLRADNVAHIWKFD